VVKWILQILCDELEAPQASILLALMSYDGCALTTASIAIMVQGCHVTLALTKRGRQSP
jgi:hypothetical protein